MVFDTNNLIHYYSDGWFCSNEIEEDLNRLSICKKRIFENLFHIMHHPKFYKDIAKGELKLNMSETVRILDKYDLKFDYDFDSLIKEYKRVFKSKKINFNDFKNSIFKTDEIYEIKRKRENDK